MNVKRHLTQVALCTLAISAASISNISLAGEIIFNDAANAKMARLKSKVRVLKNTRGSDVVPSALGAEAPDEVEGIEQNCGSIGIANQVKPNIGRSPRKTEVLIVGDVINAGNTCR